MLSAFRSSARTVSRKAFTSPSVVVARSTPSLALAALRIAPRLLSTSAARGYQQDGFNSRPQQSSNQAVYPPSSTLFVGNLPWEASEADITDLFKVFGNVSAIRIGKTGDGRPRGFAHVEFETVAGATAALEASRNEPVYMGDRTIRLDYAPGRQQIVNPPHHKLYISGFNGSEAELRSAFSEFENSVVGTYMLKAPQTGELIGTGFIDFMSTERATEALKQLNGQASPYGVLNLAYARPPRPRQSGAFGGGFNNSRQGGGSGGYGGGGGGSGGYGNGGGY